MRILDNGYIAKNHGVFKLNAHIVLVCKYRKPLLRPGLDEQMYTIINDIGNEKNFQVIEQGGDIDHLHILISYDANASILSIIKLIKQISTFRIWRQNDNGLILSQHFRKEKTFWSDGYFVSSVGQTNYDIVKKYIESQGEQKIL